MMYFKFVEEYRVLNILDEPMKNESGEDVKNKQYEFLVGRLTDPVFTEGLDGYEAILLVTEVKEALKKQKEKASEIGHWEIENDPGRRLKEATLKPKNKYNPMYSHGLLDFMNAVKNMVSDDPAKLNAVP